MGSRDTADASPGDRRRPLNMTRVGTYQRLMDVQDQIAWALYERGISDQTIVEALDASEPPDALGLHEVDLYLDGLRRYVGLLGGRLELRAVFDEEVISLIPDAPS